MQCKKFLTVFVLFIGLVMCKKFPSYIEKCRKTDTDIKKCLSKAVQNLKPHLLTGIPEFQLPRMDPLKIPEVGFEADGSFNAKFQNVEIYEADKFNINDFNMDLDKNLLNFNFNFPYLRIKAHYYIVGKVLFLTLNGNGPAEGNITNVNVDATMTGYRHQKKNGEYIKLSDFIINDMNFGKPQFEFFNLFRNNTELTEQTNKILNQNILEILEELKPVLENTIGKTVLEFIGRVFDRFSVDELFLQ